MSKMTEGPWKTRKLKRSIEVFWPETGKKIALIPLQQFVENTGNEANATAIAALPELIEALENLIVHCSDQEQVITEQLFHEHYSGESEPLCKSRAALRKAGVS